MTPSEFASILKEDSKIRMVFDVLKDREWHCRECEYAHIGITQIAGGSGIQGLQRGTHSRPGLEIDSNNHWCCRCERMTRHDRWRGSFQTSLQAGAIPKSFAKKAILLSEKPGCCGGCRKNACPTHDRPQASNAALDKRD